jgi:hypothetical protein
VGGGGGAGIGGEGEGDSGTSAAAGGVEAPVQVGVGAESAGEGGRGGARRQVYEDASASAVGGETVVRQEAEAEAADVSMTLSAALHRCADVAKRICYTCGVVHMCKGSSPPPHVTCMYPSSTTSATPQATYVPPPHVFSLYRVCSIEKHGIPSKVCAGSV